MQNGDHNEQEKGHNKAEELIWEWPCPNPKCGSTERLVQTVLELDRAKGRVEDDIVWGVVDSEQVQIIGKKVKPGDEVSGIKVFSDICLKCGTLYRYRAVRRVFTAVKPEKQKAPPGSGLILPGGMPLPNRAQRRHPGKNN